LRAPWHRSPIQHRGGYDVGVTPEQAPYFSMQYLSGGDLAARAQRGMSEQQLFETLAGSRGRSAMCTSAD
jgi:hypothetical protein